MIREINVIDYLKEADGGYVIIEARDSAGEGWVNIMKIAGEVLVREKGVCPNINIAEFNTDGTVDTFPAQIVAIFKTVTGVVDETLVEFYERYTQMPMKTTILNRTTPFGELVYFSNEFPRCDYQLVNGIFGVAVLEQPSLHLSPFVVANGKLIFQDGSSAYINSVDKDGIFTTSEGVRVLRVLMVAKALNFTTMMTYFNKVKNLSAETLGENLMYKASSDIIEREEKGILEQQVDG